MTILIEGKVYICGFYGSFLVGKRDIYTFHIHTSQKKLDKSGDFVALCPERK